MDKGELFITNDIEKSGDHPFDCSILSWAACVVTQEDLTKDELREKGLVFYDELKPQPGGDGFELEAMKIGCLGLECLGEARSLPCFDPEGDTFEPKLVMDLLERQGTEVHLASVKLISWIEAFQKEGFKVVPVFDTCFMDPPEMRNYFYRYGRSNPYGFYGENVRSLYRGYRQSWEASYKSDKERYFEDRGLSPHHALHDAMALAHIWREVVFNGTFT